MRYFIAHLVTGSAKRYRDRVVRELQKSHRIKVPKRHSPPHITIKPPFECGLMGIVKVEKALRAYVRLQSAPRFRLKGFGRFGFKTIYLDVYRSPDAVTFVRGLVRHLNHTVRWLPRTPQEGNKLHLSVARHLDRKTSARIWPRVKHLDPDFEGRMDTVVVLKRVKDKWIVRTTLKIPRTEHLPM